MAARTKFKVSDEVREILRRAAWTPPVLKLSAGDAKLDRKLYLEVNKALEGAGGKWNRKLGGHAFDADPRELLGEAVETGLATNKKTMLQAFYTPPDLARRVAEIACLKDGMTVLEPSAGHGALAIAARELAKVKVTCFDVDPEACVALEDAGFIAHCRDFLSLHAPIRGGPLSARAWGPFDRVLMNPPFSHGNDIDHVTHALRFLAPGGRLTAIMPASAPTGTTRLHRNFHALLKQYVASWEELPEGSFAESGTHVRTSLLTAVR